ncbi:MAG: hypothetical protein LBQ87_07610 [Candidatus Fibromonas sp.]|jgi:hypothetical protein|nr:hypothetical protein [Candidatus Fibromonas sp.]
MFLAILNGNFPPIRAMYVLPLAFAFMFFFLVENNSKKVAIAVVILALFTAVHQTQITGQLLYSDQLRYNEDVRRAYNIRMINNENLPVVVIGGKRNKGENNIAKKFHANFLQGDVIGYSFFEFGKGRQTTGRSLAFMHSLGIHFDTPSDEQFEQAFNEAGSMPSYPAPGYIKKLPDVIVVKF